VTRRIVLPAVVTAFYLFAGTITQDERDFAMSELHASRKLFLDSLAGLTPAQWRFKPAAGRWSIAEIAEQVTLAEDYFFELATRKVMSSPVSPQHTKPTIEQDEAVVASAVDRFTHANTPEALRPTGHWRSIDELTQRFKASRGRTIAYVEKTQDDLRGHSMHGMDAYQWLLFLSKYTETDVRQINEVKADPNFPKH